MDMISRLPTSFLRARLELLEERLESMPIIRVGKHRNVPIIREYYIENGVKKHREHLLSSVASHELLKKAKYREGLLLAKKQIINCLVTAGGSSESISSQESGKFGLDFWNALMPCSLEAPTDSSYLHCGYRMRSRGEVMIAQVLDSLGLEYKYEPEVIVGGETYYPDFAVWFPEFGRCIFIEFLGMLDRQNYAYKNGIKIANYLNAGMVINRDILIFCGTKNSMPTADEIAEDIIALITKFCRMYSSCNQMGRESTPSCTLLSSKPVQGIVL
ncbi:MAG: hypothetical protein K6F49_01490 [Saccharofermentans sp.]|nr:hypothetical protein [Saccharofermentans sp.]